MHTDTIAGILRTQATLGERPLLVVDEQRITYAEAEARSRRIASALLDAGVGRGSHVAMLLANGPDFAAAFLAITRIGAIAMPLSTMSTAPEIRGLLRGSDAEFLISTTSYRGRDLQQTITEAIGTPSTTNLLLRELPVLRRVWFGVKGLEQAGVAQDARIDAAEAQVTSADTLLIVHTSGSTSAPKGVLHTHGQVIRNMRRQNLLRDYTDRERLFSNSPFFWIGGLAYSFISTMIAGARLICSSAEPEKMLELLEAEQPTMCNGVASTVLSLARHPSFPDRDLSSLRRGNLYPIMPANVRPVDPELRSNLLGMTETGSVSLWGNGDIDLPDSERGTFGKPVEGIEARVVDADSAEDSSEGEFWVRGPNLMQGYYGRERWECFDEQGWFHTGDIMRVDADGDFYFKGRAGDIIRTAGAQVSPREVEAVISEITGGRMSLVIGVPDPERGQTVTAVLIGNAPFDAEQLKSELKKRLSPYKIPRRFVAMTENQLPTVSSGKIDLKKLVELVRDH
jgi:acyl-CoA synthetase (AMP-forming)/AMP-acid ligase II